MAIGVLALQGAFAEHEAILAKLGVETFEIRRLADFLDNQDQIEGLILPGGESTTIGKLLHDLGLFSPIQDAIQNGLPVFGTCAGLILLAKEIAGQEQIHLATMDIIVERNAYGRQLGSFYTEEELKGIGKIPMTFIRGPIIRSVDSQVNVLAQVEGQIVAARQGNMLVTSFHPELNEDTRLHQYFLKICRGDGSRPCSE